MDIEHWPELLDGKTYKKVIHSQMNSYFYFLSRSSLRAAVSEVDEFYLVARSLRGVSSKKL